MAETGEPAVMAFRDLYTAIAWREGASAPAIAKQVLLPPQSLGAALPPAALAAADPIAAVAPRFQTLCPSQLYENGLQVAGQEEPDPRPGLAAEPVTLLVVPGILAEWIDDVPFEEVMQNQQSSFARAHAAALAALRTQAYDVQALAKTERSLGELVTVASLDDASGHALVNLILLRPVLGTLETVAAHAEVLPVLLDRIDLVMRALPLAATPALHVLGYSRGGPLGLELLAAAFADAPAHPWTARVRGFVSLAGVLYGSELADQTVADAGSMDYRALHTLLDLADRLEVAGDGDGAIAREAMKLRNTGRWIKALAEVVTIVANAPSEPGLDREPRGQPMPAVGPMLALVRKVATELFAIDRPGEYFDNVRRFQVLMHAVLGGVKDLSSEARLAFWRQSTLPLQLRYYALTATMAERHSGAESVLASSEYYGADTTDFSSLRRSYYGLARVSGVDLEDSQVTLPRARFWPELTAHWHGPAASYRAQFLGVIACHHWGIAFPEAFRSANGRHNVFPRKVLLKALGAYLHQFGDR